MDKLQTPEELATAFMKFFDRHDYCGPDTPEIALASAIKARDSAVRAPLIEALENVLPLAVAWMGSYGEAYGYPMGYPTHQKIIAKAKAALEAAKGESWIYA